MLVEAADGLVGVPVVTERVGPEVSDQVALAGRVHDVHDRQQEAVGRGALDSLQDDPDVTHQPARQSTPGVGDRPGALHAQVRVQGEIPREPGEQVLAVRHVLHDAATGEVDGGDLRSAEVGAGEPTTLEPTVELAGDEVDAVSFWHGSAVRQVDGADATFHVLVIPPRSADIQLRV